MKTEAKIELRLAGTNDARPIGRMARDLIETGLGWSWTPFRVVRQILDAETLVLTARDRGQLVGFAIMHFLEEEAHLYLLAVAKTHRRRGLAGQMLAWLESSARVAGITAVHLEVRARNRGARAFYRAQGYREREVIRGYYQGREPAVRMSRNISLHPGPADFEEINILLSNLGRSGPGQEP